MSGKNYQDLKVTVNLPGVKENASGNVLPMTVRAPFAKALRAEENGEIELAEKYLQDAVAAEEKSAQ